MIFLGLQALISLAVLLYSAEKFVDGAAGSARLLGVSPFLIGVFILGFGTSAPEIIVSILSALKGNPGVALGNAYGSNIANIGLVLGVTAVVSPLVMNSKALRDEMFFLVGVTFLTWALLWDPLLSFWKASLLMIAFVSFAGWTLYKGRKSRALRRAHDAFVQEVAKEIPQDMTLVRAVFSLVLGGVFLIISSHFLVEAAVELARIWGVSDLVIGLTLVAVGTSLPELVASLVAIKKNEHALAFGNVIGSNLFNTLVVVGIAGLIRPFPAESAILTRDLPVMTVLTFMIVGLRCLPFRSSDYIGRFEGGLYFVIYAAYMTALTFMGGD